MQSSEESNSKPESTISGTISRVTFHNPENAYSVLQVELADEADTLTVVGIFLNPNQGMHIHARGKMTNHSKFGKQFQAASITEVVPSTAEGIEKYLSSGLIKGIGEKTAERIVKKFGDKSLEIIYQEPERIAAIKGISLEKARQIHEACLEQKESQDSMRFLVENGVTPGLAQKIIERYKLRTIEIISKDPYLLARQIRGIGFTTADKIAIKLGIEPESPVRLKAGLFYALEKSADDGHCFLPLSDLFRRAYVLLGLTNQVDLTEYLEELVREDFFVKRDSDIYLKPIAVAEDFTAKFIKNRLEPEKHPDISKNAVNRALKLAEDELSLTFSEEQRSAVHAAATQSLLVITGGPGCGKTTLIKALSILFKENGKRLLLAAPTGRAAQRMAQVCDTPASTIHRLLKYDPRTSRFTYGINDPLQVDAIIIDEASMIDIVLAKDLFSAIPMAAKLILVGDKDQLPSVGPGRVFSDIISARAVTTVSLSKLFRRDEESSINNIAFQINSGVTPQIPEPDGTTKSDSYFINKREAEEAAITIEKLLSDQIPRKFGIQLKDISVLTPSNRGPLGTIELNKRLQAVLNPPTMLGIDGELDSGSNIFRLGDRVCQRVNNYQIDSYGVFNGDVGRVYSVNRPARELTVEFWDGRLIKYGSNDLHQLSLSYAVTVHRSQGSEIPCVVLVLTDSHFNLLERQLIYTAVTRAKKLLIIVGSKRALDIACKKITTQKRCTALARKILN